jgi:hypothetical protein
MELDMCQDKISPTTQQIGPTHEPIPRQILMSLVNSYVSRNIFVKVLPKNLRNRTKPYTN